MPVNNLIKFRQGTSSSWSTSNPILGSGEPGFDTTNNILKIGNGTSTWSTLSNHAHTSVDITDFNSAVSGLLPTISSSGDNRVLTSTGSINGINAESNLTFDGTNLTINNGDCIIGALKSYKFNGNAWGYDRIIFRSDVNNKITSDANGNYNWLVAGRNWTLSDVGNVGIGTISPSSTLHISKNDATVRIGDAGSNAGTGPRLELNSKYGASEGFAYLGFSFYNNKTYLQHGRAFVGGLELRTANGTPRLYVQDSNGNIGIGTASPSSPLHVVGSGLFTSDLNASRFISSQSSGDEGGEILLTKPATNSSISGNLTIDLWQNRLRIFETTGSNRGYYLDVTEGASTAGTPLKTKTLASFTALDNQPPASAFATLDTRNSIAVLDFDDTTEESCVFIGVIPDNANLSSGLSVRIHWMATTATSGNCRWGVQFEDMNTDTDADSFAAATEAHSATNGTAGIPTTTTITCTTIDSLVAGDFFRIKIYRDVSDTTNDTMTGDAELIAVEVRSVL
jgi:hypothetical protein